MISLIKYFFKAYKQLNIKNGTKSIADTIPQLVPIVNVRINQDKPKDVIKFYCFGSINEWRANTLFSKEPETISWIKSFEDSDVFFDVGANVGVYSLYAGKIGIKTFSFEPYFSNAFILSQNILINDLSDKISPFQIALFYKNKIANFEINNPDFGSALNSISEDVHNPGFYNSCLAMTLDHFIINFSDGIFPNHLKIDVDGNEHEILLGAKDVLSSMKLKSLMIELDRSNTRYDDCVGLLIDSGFSIDQIFSSQNHYNSSTCNHLFKR